MSARTRSTSDSIAPEARALGARDLEAHCEMLDAENAELRRALKLRDRMLDLTSKGCVIINARGAKPTTIFVNRALARLTGYEVNELVGLGAEIITEAEGGKGTQILKIEGRVSLRGVTFESICDAEGRATHYVGVVADAAAKLAAERAREELLSRLAAESRERQRVESELHEAQKFAAATRLADGVAHVFRAKTASSDDPVAGLFPADINHVVETTLIVAKYEYKHAADVVTRFAELPPVHCNVGELMQILLNLVVVAAQAITKSGKSRATGWITVMTRLAGNAIEIEFAHNGAETPVHDLQDAHSIVAMHLGELRVESDAEVTRVIIRLPIAGRQEQEASV